MAHTDRRTYAEVVSPNRRNSLAASVKAPLTDKAYRRAKEEEQEEATRRWELLDKNRAERERRAQRKQDKAKGIDHPAQDDDEARPDSNFTSEPVISKAASKRATLVERQGKVPPSHPTPSWVHESQPLVSTYGRNENQPSPYSHHGSLSHSQSRSHLRGHNNKEWGLDPIPDEQAEDDYDPSHYHSDHSRSCSPQQSRSRSYSPQQSHSYSPEHLPTPSQSSTGKRAHSPDIEALVAPIKAQKVTENSGRPKASDYDEVAKEVILTATGIYRCLIATSNPFPTPLEETELVRIAWDRANQDTAQDIPLALSPAIAKVISARGSQVRSEVKAHALNFVETLYGFESGQGKHILKANRSLAESLKKNSSGYLFKDREAQKGLYQHPAIQKIINKTWFNNPRDEGIVYADLFDPLSVEALALVITAIECAIDAWATGSKSEVPFYSSEYKSIYIRHVKTLCAYGIATSKHDLLGLLQRSSFNFGRLHAGVKSKSSKNTNLVVLDETAFAAALKEHEEADDTEDDREDID